MASDDTVQNIMEDSPKDITIELDSGAIAGLKK